MILTVLSNVKFDIVKLLSYLKKTIVGERLSHRRPVSSIETYIELIMRKQTLLIDSVLG